MEHRARTPPGHSQILGLRVFTAEHADWAGTIRPPEDIRLMDDATFTSGRKSKEEGGIKGHDISADGELLVTTGERHVLTLYHLPSLLKP